ncbi:MAG: hypothetical protein AAF628_03735 [Planctomycetota bacterium]
MYYGSFPRSSTPGRSHLPLAEPRSNRRQWAIGAAGLVFGAAGAGLWQRLGTAGAPAASHRSVDWALEQLMAPREQQLRAAADIERVATRAPQDVRLVPVLLRLVDLAVLMPGAAADRAGACGVRSLHRLGRRDLLAAAAQRIVATADRPQTSAALAAAGAPPG